MNKQLTHKTTISLPQDCLNIIESIKAVTGEDTTSIIRRLIREAKGNDYEGGK